MKKPIELLVAAAILVCVALPSVAQQTITVTAVGEAKVKPDTLVLTGEISDASEKMKDAVTGFRDTRRRAMAAFKELGIENLSIQTSALSMSIAGPPQEGPFGGGGGEVAAPGALMIKQTVTLTVTGIDAMQEAEVVDLTTQLMQGAKDAGVSSTAIGMQGMMMMQIGMGGNTQGSAMFKISSPKSAKQAATRDAVAKAREDAALLAELAGGTLGKIVRISDGIGAASDDQTANPYAMIWGAMLANASDPHTNETTDDVTITRPLTVTFELVTE